MFFTVLIDDERKTIFIESTPNGMSILSLHASEDAIHVPKVQFIHPLDEIHVIFG